MEMAAIIKRELAGNIHKLSLCLLKASSHKIVYNTLFKGLKEYYLSDQVLLLVFGKNKLTKNYKGLQFLVPSSELDFMFTEIFQRDKPLCDSLQQEQIETFFGKNAQNIFSTILIPMQQSNWHGLLVLGSQERNHYSHGFALDLLLYLSNTLGLIINSWLR
jgi:uncharacterized protein YigA (DUF484 family)